MADYYGLLKIRRDATQDEVKRAYRRLARELHPDVNPDPETQERFKEITQAYEVLSDVEKRRMYDMGVDPFAAAGTGAGAGPFGPGFSPLSDLLDQFFGGAGGATTRGPRSRAQRGRNATIRIELDLSECSFGATRELTVDTAVVCTTCSGEGTAPGTHPQTCDICGGRGEVSQVTRSFIGQVMMSRPCPGCGGYGTVLVRPCPECDGDGRVRTRRTIKVRIPAGVEDGTHIQLAGEGEVGPGGGPPGDLFLEIVQRPHAIFERQGDDLHCTVTIPMVAAALGATLSVDSLDGPADIDIRPGTQSGQVIPLYGQGVKHLNGNGRGDLVIHVTVETPTKLDAEQEKLLRDLAKIRGEESPPGRFCARPAEVLLQASRRVQRALTPGLVMPQPPVFLAGRAELGQDLILLSGAEGRHAATVRRMRPGERADVADGAGLVAECVVAGHSSQGLELAVLARRAVPRPDPSITVVQAIPKGERGELAVEEMTEVGVDRIVPWAAARSVAIWRAERGARSLGRWRATAREAAKQSRRAWIPEVTEPVSATEAAAVITGRGVRDRPRARRPPEPGASQPAGIR